MDQEPHDIEKQVRAHFRIYESSSADSTAGIVSFWVCVVIAVCCFSLCLLTIHFHGFVGLTWFMLSIGLCFATMAAIWLRLRPIHRRYRRLITGRCLYCGYDLRATSGRCPECGRMLEKTEG